MFRVDYYDYGSCRVKYFNTQKDVDSFCSYMANYPDFWRFRLLYVQEILDK